MERMKILSNKKYNSLIIEIETLKEIRENDEMCINMMADRINRLNQLEEENKKLKSDLAFERTMLDNVRAEYKSLQNVIKKLKARIEIQKLNIQFFEKELDLYQKLHEKTLSENKKLKEKYGDIDY